MDSKKKCISIYMRAPRRYNSKMFYLTTFINMFILPFVFFFYTIGGMYKVRYHTMQVNMYNPKNRFEKEIYQTLQRQCLQILLTGDTNSDNIKIRFGQVYIRQILDTKDTVHAIEFHFGGNSKFWEFVAILDVCNMEDVRCYIVTDSSIKMLYYKPKPLKKYTPEHISSIPHIYL